MIEYSINWMGPINTDWIKQHGDQWSAGRIDIYGTNTPFGEELGVPPMHKEDWDRFSEWLRSFKTETSWSLFKLITEYQKTNPKILWLYGEPVNDEIRQS